MRYSSRFVVYKMWFLSLTSTQICSYFSKVFSRFYSTVFLLCFGAGVVLISFVYNQQQQFVTVSSRHTAAGDVARRQLVLIVSEGRSGSSFTLQLLGSLPLSLTHFEPLLLLPDNSTTAPANFIQDLFNCRFGSISHEILFERNNPAFMWNICWNNNQAAVNDICYNLTALQEICKRFPVQVFYIK